MEFQTFTRKPFQVRGVQVGPHNEAAVAEWCGGSLQATSPKQGLRRYIQVDVPGAKNVRQTRAYHGDWILTTGNGYKVYTDTALLKDFDVEIEDPCGETQYTVDHKPCVLGKGHRHTAALIGCRSLQDYLVVNANYTVNLAQEIIKTDQFDRTGAVKFPASALDADMGPALKEPCA